MTAPVETDPIERLKKNMDDPMLRRTLNGAVAEGQEWISDYRESTELLSLDGDLDGACAAWADMMSLPGTVPSIVCRGAVAEIGAYLRDLGDEPFTEEPDLTPIGSLLKAVSDEGLRMDCSRMIPTISNGLIEDICSISDGAHASRLAYFLGEFMIQSFRVGSAMSFIGSSAETFSVFIDVLSEKRGGRPIAAVRDMVAFYEDLAAAAKARKPAPELIVPYAEAWSAQGFDDMAAELDEIRLGYCEGSLDRDSGPAEIDRFIDRYLAIEPVEGFKGKECPSCRRWATNPQWEEGVCPRCGYRLSEEDNAFEAVIGRALRSWDLEAMVGLSESDGLEPGQIWYTTALYGAMMGFIEPSMDAICKGSRLWKGGWSDVGDVMIMSLEDAFDRGRNVNLDGRLLAQMVVSTPDGAGIRDRLYAQMAGYSGVTAAEGVANIAVSHILTDGKEDAEDALLQAYMDLDSMSERSDDPEVTELANVIDGIYEIVSGLEDWDFTTRNPYGLFSPIYRITRWDDVDGDDLLFPVRVYFGLETEVVDLGAPWDMPVDPGVAFELAAEGVTRDIDAEGLAAIADEMIGNDPEDWRAWFIQGLARMVWTAYPDDGFASWTKAAEFVPENDLQTFVTMVEDSVVFMAEDIRETGGFSEGMTESDWSDAVVLQRILDGRFPDAVVDVISDIVDNIMEGAMTADRPMIHVYDIHSPMLRMFSEAASIEDRVSVCRRFQDFSEETRSIPDIDRSLIDAMELFFRTMGDLLEEGSAGMDATARDEVSRHWQGQSERIYITLERLSAIVYEIHDPLKLGTSDEYSPILVAELEEFVDRYLSMGDLPRYVD